MALEIRDIVSGDEWNRFVQSHAEANFLQSWQWGEFHLSRGKQVIRRGIYEDAKLVGVYEGVVETAKRGTYMAIAGGPIVDWSKKTLLKKLRDDMKQQAATNGCVFVRVRPQLEKTAQSMKLFAELGFKKAPIYLSVEHAGVLDLTKSEEEIIAGTRERLRRALRKAEKNDIQIETSIDPESIREFYQIQMQTARRHDFVSFSEDFLVKQFAAFAATGSAVLYTARYQGDILAQNFIIFYGNEASYHYGASTELGTQLSGAPLLHMQAMRDARERGIGRYNFWGIVDENDTKHRYYGVSVFKRGFGVSDLKYTPAHDLIINPSKYLLTWSVETLRRLRRHV